MLPKESPNASDYALRSCCIARDDEGTGSLTTQIPGEIRNESGDTYKKQTKLPIEDTVVTYNNHRTREFGCEFSKTLLSDIEAHAYPFQSSRQKGAEDKRGSRTEALVPFRFQADSSPNKTGFVINRMDAVNEIP